MVEGRLSMDDQDVPTILDDLQLAAELGKTLLERNKELEQALKHANVILDDQSQEIEYLRKQNAALREVNDSRLRIYEQLEISIQDLEREKHRLAVENATERKKIKSLMLNTETLEAKNLELSRNADELNVQLEIERRKCRRLLEENEQRIAKPNHLNLRMTHETQNEETPTNADPVRSFASEVHEAKMSDNGLVVMAMDETDDTELLELRVKYEAACQRVNELEDQIQCLREETLALKTKISSLENQELNSVHQELIWQGLCNPYMGSLEANFEPEEDFSIDETESLTERAPQPASEYPSKEDKDASNKDAMHEHVFRSTADVKSTTTTTSQPSSEVSVNPYKQLVEKYEALMEVQRNKSLADELAVVSAVSGAIPKSPRPIRVRVPSLEEDACAKQTQTDESSLQLFATMANFYNTSTGSDVIESRFRNRPEYKDLFKEIFDTLKTMSVEDVKPEPEHEERFNAVYNMFEELSVDETQSIDSSVMSEMSEQSIMSERITKIERKNIKKAKKTAEKDKGGLKQPLVMGLADGRIVTPYNRDPLTDVINISGKKRARHSKKKAKMRSGADSPAPFTSMEDRTDSPTPSLVERYRSDSSEVEFKPSTASQNLHKLKKLDLSYAEVLRQATKTAPQAKYARRK